MCKVTMSFEPGPGPKPRKDSLGHGPKHLTNYVNVMSSTLHGFVLGL
jgi:hypothetical protein